MIGGQHLGVPYFCQHPGVFKVFGALMYVVFRVLLVFHAKPCLQLNAATFGDS